MDADLHIFESRGIYIVEGYERPAEWKDAHHIFPRSNGHREWIYEEQKPMGEPLSLPRLIRQKKETKNHREIRKCSPNSAEMTGDSCLARAVVPRTAAAVDHADTELIGQTGHRVSL